MPDTGRILRFDEIRGYGFILPDKGGEDVFVHANEFCNDKELFAPGTPVEYEVAEGDRGLRAFAVHVAAPAQAASPKQVAAPALAEQETTREDEVMADVLTRAELEHEFTEIVLRRAADLTGVQILKLREAVVELAHGHGWTEEPPAPPTAGSRTSSPSS